ncbi:MAG TPA: sulfatase-like hydrolase/transferase, partial [Candidatus Thalassarchaeaceae archaeon]|nr:sulfatase-like hydrolase/transferase [Candidatus Thalassarchaeaceae archaeon]
MEKSIIYIATDRLYARRLRLHGGFNRMPNMERMAEDGTLYNNATACAGSTLMTHSCEWTGRYSANLHGDLPYEERLYNTKMPEQDSVFQDFLDKGFEVYIVLVEKRPGKSYDSYKPIFNLWPKEANIVKLPDWDLKGGENIRRKDQIMKAAELVDASEKNGKPAFVFIKCHGYNKSEYRSEYLRYAGQQRVTDDDLYNCEIDEGLGYLLDHYNYPSNKEAPTIWFASDHGSWMGESFRNHYGYHLHQEIVHVPLIGSRGGGKVVDNVFSMKEVRRIITDNSPNMSERYVFAETLYPGQITEKPDNGV